MNLNKAARILKKKPDEICRKNSKNGGCNSEYYVKS